jgi:hypothetical protein
MRAGELDEPAADVGCEWPMSCAYTGVTSLAELLPPQAQTPSVVHVITTPLTNRMLRTEPRETFMNVRGCNAGLPFGNRYPSSFGARPAPPGRGGS